MHLKISTKKIEIFRKKLARPKNVIFAIFLTETTLAALHHRPVFRGACTL